MRLSTSATLDQVFPLFADDASYMSESLGSSWTGLGSIRGMMEPFFAKFPDIRWEVTRMGVVAPSEPAPGAVRVEVAFVRRWTSESGEAMVRGGREWIHVDPASGRIVHVHVAALDPA
ncbi:hypothetical protein GPECTOR_20g474 [Gonium pectorale]|uniref:SnoaL-like domain-containing protein n=1 Tax=Gonium pectorale TaxID=33097 RepID=A0A150GIH6_GONPE|nr:hypothetical protein GPECTOR_20g474 [Gonium pectorale]|eukprot:KXZ49617.1 hypothetical protein GPECTOR_20g474 [Gonium pectorale]